ncbi:MAG: TGS domain-containing protein, partial [Odoribacteraceae bacterium]|nr:TGS domain-containing protein [Odoribacteraceae bacterium]
KWLVDIREMLERADSTGPLELLDNIKLSLFTKEIHVYTPKGDKKILPKGACVLDSAYAIHSELGDRCIGAKVNNNLEPVSHPLQDGDRVEILTGEKQVPNAEWVKFIVTAKARQHIMAALREERKEQTRQGLQIYEDLLQKNNLVPTQGQLDRTLHRLGLTDKDALYLALYKQQISQEQLRKALIGNRLMRYFGLQSAGPREAVAKPTTDENREQKNAPAGQDVKNDPTVVIATDCNPIPGDTVVAFDINGETVVHKRTCKEAIRLMASRGHRIITNVPWAKSNVESFLAAVHLRGIDNIGIASEVTRVISKESNVNMRSIRFDTRDGLFDGTILLDVHNTTDLNNLMAKIATLSGVKKVTRIENIETTENPSRKQ